MWEKEIFHKKSHDCVVILMLFLDVFLPSTIIITKKSFYFHVNIVLSFNRLDIATVNSAGFTYPHSISMK